MWSIDDGRCVMTSPLMLFDNEKLIKILKVDDQLFSGILLCFSSKGTIFVINVFTMTVLKKVNCGIEVLQVQMLRNDEIIQLTFFDRSGKIQVWSTSKQSYLIDLDMPMSAAQCQKFRQSITKKGLKQISNLQLNHCNYNESTSQESKILISLFDFTLKQETRASPTFTVEPTFQGRGAHHELLGFQRKVLGAQHTFVVVYQDRIEIAGKKGGMGMSKDNVVVQYEHEVLDDSLVIGGKNHQVKPQHWFVTCAFKKIGTQQTLICVDSRLHLLIYDVDILLKGKENTSPIMEMSLFENSRLFNFNEALFSSEERTQLFGLSKDEKHQVYLAKFKQQLGSLIKSKELILKFDNMMLYTFMRDNTKSQQFMLSWCLLPLSAALKNPSASHALGMTINCLNLQETKSAFQQLNINRHISQNYFSKHQHSFFNQGEKVTEQTFFVSSEYPSVILGTNHGRVFIVQLFQDIEERSYPVLVIDCHQQSQITQLYVAYSPSRKVKNATNQQVSQETGGHLIATSENGTLSITDLTSTIITEGLTNFTLRKNDDPERQRADHFLNQRELSQRLKRRHSFQADFSFKNYFNLMKVKPLKVYPNCSFGPLSKVFEVKIIQDIQISLSKYLQQALADNTKATLLKSEGLRERASIPKQQIDLMGDNSPFSPSRIKERDRDEGREQGESRFQSLNQEQIMQSQLNIYGDKQAQSLRDLSLTETLAQSKQLPICNELMPFKARYACIDCEQNAVYLLTIEGTTCDLLKMQGLDSEPIGVYEDVLQNLIHVITDQSLNIYTFSRTSKQLLRKNNYLFALEMLQINQQIIVLTELQQHFRQAQRLEKLANQEQLDLFSFMQQYVYEAAHKKTGTCSASGHHRVLDYLSMSLSLPLYYHPHTFNSQKFTKSVKDLLPHYKLFKNQLLQSTEPNQWKQNAANSMSALRAIIEQHFVWNQRYKSDFSQEFYQAQGAVTPLVTGTNGPADKSFRQQMIIINTKDMINIYKSRMKALQDSLVQFNKKEDGTFIADAIVVPNDNDIADAPKPPDISAAYFQNSRWPTRLLSLVHPFLLDPNLDENLEMFFGLNVPFLDLCIGVQGIDETFSFLIQKDNIFKKQEEHFLFGTWKRLENDKLINYLKISKSRRLQMESKMLEFDKGSINKNPFLNSEQWKVSSFMNTVISCFFLSTLVSVVEYAQNDITILLQDWLNVIQFITSSGGSGESEQGSAPDVRKIHKLIESIETPAKPLSMSVISQLMLRKDHSISSCARDMLMKPLMNSGSSLDHIKAEINEWQDLIMDTYLNLKEDSSKVQGHKQLPAESVQNIVMPSQPHGQITSTGFHPGHSELSPGQKQETQTINHFFGELEIRGLINLSQFALWKMDADPKYRIDTDVLNRLCKCTVILSREIQTKFIQNSKEHQNLLTILMQLLQTQMRAKVPTFQTKVIKEDVIKILLRIYDFYKKQLRNETFLTKVVAENFHLVHPKNSEMYLKLTAAKTLLEVGTFFTEDFLKLIHEQATHLKEGPEYQKNVLDVLRYFISCSRGNLDQYLIQIVQTLLKCLDPSDEQLRKNSTTPISNILSIMVKSFPIVAFHHDNQRIAVGTPSGPIAIYDIKTSQKWKVLEGHNKKISCCEFDVKGNELASYVAEDCALRVWKTGNPGLISTFFGDSKKNYKEFKLRPLTLPGEIPQIQKQGTARKSSIQKSSPSVNYQKCKIKFVKDDKGIELQRENGQVEFIQISK